jgi:hypothetical protein
MARYIYKVAMLYLLQRVNLLIIERYIIVMSVF